MIRFVSPKRLREQGVVGLNQRNGQYVLVNNKRKFYPRVDNKLITKELAIKAGIAVPELYGVIETNHDANNIEHILHGKDDFVIKPAHGSGGDGIVVVVGKSGKLYRRASGTLMSMEQVGHHVSNILSGMYSLGGQPDYAMIEYRVRFDPLFAAITFQGVPDIRTVVYKGFPAMAMVRLPTRNSDGKANLHQGAVGAGIEIATGITKRGVQHNLMVDVHPDTGNDIAGLAIPNWDKLLLLATSCYELSGLGYLGVDVVLDADHGPLILELNARPGLNIQIANGIGLDTYLKVIDKEGNPEWTPENRIAFVKDKFGTLKPA